MSEVLLSEVLQDNDNKRIDAEYFKKEFLNFFKNIPNLRNLSDFVEDGYRVVYENTKVIEKEVAQEKNYPIFLQATDLSTPFIRTNNFSYVDNQDWERYKKGRIKTGEILIEVKGKVEKVAIVPDDFPTKTLVSGSLYKMTVNEKMSKYVLLTYLISRYGTAFKNRYKTNLLISFISKPDLYRIPVPYFSVALQKQIDEIFIKIFSNQKQSALLYTEAENLLLENLGLQNFQATNQSVNIKSLKESFLQTGRLDAEYYQPKFARLFKCLSKFQTVKLGDVADLQKSVEPGSDAYQTDGIPFIRVSDLSKFGINHTDKYLNPDDFKGVIRPKKDTVLLTKDGTVGIAYCVPEDLNVITSGAVVHLSLKTDEILPDYLALVLNSKAVQLQAERDAGGSVIQHWKPSEILDVVIPVLPKETQLVISGKIRQSFALRQESQILLEQAKILVEREIERMNH